MIDTAKRTATRLNQASPEELDQLEKLLNTYRTSFPLMFLDKPEDPLLERDTRGFYLFKPDTRRKFIVIFYKKS